MVFGYVMANYKELSSEDRKRYGAVYCGLCRKLRELSSQTARLTLSYDCAFLALLLMSLYEPEETFGKRACALHPIRPRPFVDNPCIHYSAAMNVALAYYNALDDYEDEKKLSARLLASKLLPDMPRLHTQYPRQCAAIEAGIARLKALQKQNCPNPDEPASCFGEILGELFVYKEDLWADALRQMGMALGRYIYLADAAVDYKKDKKTGQYNPYLAMGAGEDPTLFEEHLVLAMGRCTHAFEKLPLVQDKSILNNILYSGVWIEYRRRQGRRPQEDRNDR